MQKLPSKKSLYQNEIKFKIGESYDLEEIKKKLIHLGYSRCDLIEGKRQFSIRGGILDISENDKTGIRIEFWGDEVDSIRDFSITSQRSINTKETAIIYPAHEYCLEKNVEEICKKIQAREGDEETILEDIEQIKAGDYISKIDKYFDSFYEEQETILDYLSTSYCVFLDEIGKIKARAKNIQIDNDNLIKLLVEKNKFVPDAIKNILTFDKIEEILDKKQLIYIDKQDTESQINGTKYKFNYRDVNYYKSEIEGLFKEIGRASCRERV